MAASKNRSRSSVKNGSTRNKTSSTNGSHKAPVPAEQEVIINQLRARYVERMVNRMEAFVENAYTMRRQSLSNMFGGSGTRDIDKECHYDTKNLTPFQYKDMYDWEPIAARVVEVEPKETWQVQPTVYESERSEVVTPFEKAWNSLFKNTLGEKGYRVQEEGNPIWEYLRRADIQSGIGHYGVILLGFGDLKAGDSRSLMSPVPGVENPSTRVENMPLNYIRIFPEALAPVSIWETNRHSPRYGMPREYRITFNDSSEMDYIGVGSGTVTEQVHWSRVIHIADNLTSSEIVGMPRMKQVIKRLYDLAKEYASAGEAFWQSCFSMTVTETHPELGGDVEVDETALRRMWEDIRNGLQREMLLIGMTAKTLPPQALDPSPWITAAMEAICIKIGMPVRIFRGSERGELASSQDDVAWNDRIRARQHHYVTPRIIDPVVNRLINAGCLPVPPLGYRVWWPDLTSKSDQEKAMTAMTETSTISAYVSAGLNTFIKPMAFMTEIMKKDEKTAKAMLVQVEFNDGIGDPMLTEEDLLNDPILDETSADTGEPGPGEEAISATSATALGGKTAIQPTDLVK